MRIDRTEVKAPVAGLVSRRSARLGATRRRPASRCSASSRTARSISRPTRPSSRWRASPSACRRSCPARRRRPVAGQVRLVDQEVDKASRTGKVRIALADVSHAHIGAFASGEVELARRDGVGAPATAVERDGDAARLWSCATAWSRSAR